MKNKIFNKIICVIAIISLCSIYALPIYAVSPEDTLYNKMNNVGEIYKSVQNGEEKENDMPIDTQIKYFLDDEEISVEEIKGKSGKVKIEINYTNKDIQEVEIDGKTVEMYTPYLVACGMILDNTKFTDVTISSGKIIDNGSNTVLLGIALPGMQESLDLDSEDIEIPSNIVIEANVNEFELGNMYMYVEANIFDTDSLDFLDDFESIYTDIQNLKAASTQLVEGTNTLKEGTATYVEKLGEFNEGLSSYTNGVNTVSSNYTKINDGISSINTSTKQIEEGSNNLSAGITELKTNLTGLVSGLTKVQQGTDAVYAGLGQAINGVDDSIDDLTKSTSEDSKTSKNLKNLGTATETTINNLTATKSELEKTIATIEDETLKQTLQKEVNDLDKQIDELKTNVANERTAYNTAISTETTTILTGLNDLKTNLKTLQGVSEQVKGGVDTMVASSPELQKGLNSLESGSNTLSAGTSALSKGTAELSSGSNELKSGIDTLNSNTSTIANVGVQLQEGANTISNGASTLSEGMKEFDSTGIDTIYNLVNGDLRNVQTRIEKLMNLTGNKDVSYKYVLKVDSIK